MLIVAELLQIIFFARAMRWRSLLNYVGVAIFTSVMIADNYSSTFLLFAEALFLGCLLLTRWAGSKRTADLAIVRSGVAVTMGVAFLAPVIPFMIGSSKQAVREGFVNWIKLQPLSWPFTVLRDASMTRSLFYLFIALCMVGLWRNWGSARISLAFLVAWMAGPILAVFGLTYLIRPMEFPRYVLIAFIGMFALAGVGAASLRSTALRILVAALIICFSAPLVRNWLRHSHGVAWREATLLADRSSSGNLIAVFLPGYVKVVRYYLAPKRRAAAVGLRNKCGAARVLILSGQGIWPPEKIAMAEGCYPRVLARLNMVEVRTAE